MTVLSRRTNVVVCVIISLLALGAMWFLFELRYMWFVSDSDFYFLRIGFVIGLFVIIALWIWYPSRLIVTMFGIVVFAFPPLLRADRFVGLDAKFLVLAGGALVLLAGATHLNRVVRQASQVKP